MEPIVMKYVTITIILIPQWNIFVQKVINAPKKKVN